ncbi:MAG TPA: hypothetical protein VHI13_21645 [Candidatus Kapabacteria bacterium]|nr:hypothetical protein [Candidatus Kapabacteria bacterium]
MQTHDRAASRRIEIAILRRSELTTASAQDIRSNKINAERETRTINTIRTYFQILLLSSGNSRFPNAIRPAATPTADIERGIVGTLEEGYERIPVDHAGNRIGLRVANGCRQAEQ